MDKREIFIEKSMNIHNYSKVEYINSKTKVEIICKEHGSFFMKPNNHLQGQKCKKCSGKNIFTTYDFIKIANKIHKYDYSKVDYINSETKVEIICKEHGSFFMKPKEHIHQKQGCPKCGKESMSNIHRKELSILIDEFNKVHKNYYDYSMVNYKNNNTKVEIICKKHGIFKQTSKSHLRGDRCPKCSISKGELRIANFLSERNINFNIQQTFLKCLSGNNNKLKFDFYLPEMNICIEYDGEQHFKPIDYFGGVEMFEKQIERDIIKNNYCLENNIKLIRIPFDKYNHIGSILDLEI
jgi:Zn finger protein HypA/HybF involved in hydrogenase expression